jgi:type IV pilus assembly protein PilE
MNKQKAFTLIELMVTVAIVGILASIAYPTYQDSVMKSRRADAKGALLMYANTMERYFTVNNTYVGAPTNPGTTTYYTITAAVMASAYTLSAAPKDVQSKDKCGTLTLTHLGVKGSGLATADCW